MKQWQQSIGPREVWARGGVSLLRPMCRQWWMVGQYWLRETAWVSCLRRHWVEESEDEGVWQTNRRGQPFIARTKWLMEQCLITLLLFGKDWEHEGNCLRNTEIKVDWIEELNFGWQEGTSLTILHRDHLDFSYYDPSVKPSLILTSAWAEPAKSVPALTSSHLYQGALWAI